VDDRSCRWANDHVPEDRRIPTNGSKFRALSRAYLPVGYEAVRTAEFWPYRTLIERPGVVGEAWIADMDATSCAGL
jgi:hypothetical protein